MAGGVEAWVEDCAFDVASSMLLLCCEAGVLDRVGFGIVSVGGSIFVRSLYSKSLIVVYRLLLIFGRGELKGALCSLLTAHGDIIESKRKVVIFEFLG